MLKDIDCRVMAQNTNGVTVYSINEVFYDEYGIPFDYVKVPMLMISEELEDLIVEQQRMLEAHQKPIISIDNFPQEYEDI